jgi:tRNA pseudouridine55 synthase
MTTPDRPAAVLLVDKPEGPTSHDMVARARRALGTRRIGHTGTLDPFASGLMLLLVGAATRLAEYFAPLSKTYRATLRLGVATDTDDRTGTATARSDAWRGLAPAAVEAALRDRVGTALQRPPAYSARKVAGRAAYRAAREGAPVALAPSPVVIHRIDLLALELPDVTFEVECGTGTYIRALARDTGEALGVPAHLVALRRLAIGPFVVDAAVPGDALTPERAAAALVPVADALSHLCRLEVDATGAGAILHGRTQPAPATVPDAAPLLILHRGTLLAVATARDGLLYPRKVLARA